MTTSRRRFFHYAGALAGLAACRPAAAPGPTAPDPTGPAPQPRASTPLAPEPILLGGQNLKILVLGGTGFLGPHLVESMQKRGHTPTLFNRGKTRPELFPDVEKLRGNRDGDLSALKGRKWDAVIDTSGYVPRVVTASAELLRDNVRQYVFVSSISVYTDTTTVGPDESHPVATMPDPKSEEVMEFYGALKALCEGAVEKVLPGRTTNVRPGLIVGPGDPTDRFTYWPTRVAAGGEVLAPGNPGDPVQVIDVRDLADFIITTLENGHIGVFNASGPREKMSIEDVLTRSKAVSASDATFTWADAKWLESQQVSPWSDMPAWVPPEGDGIGLGTVSSARAIAHGLTYRPLDETLRATLDWWQTLPPERRAKMRAGISREREAAVLAAWHRDHPAAGKPAKPARPAGKPKVARPQAAAAAPAG
ncbi:MAG: NAD-dependent epimerase/dehydratase family protein [Myxococcales bacterium]|nr:NAD-dependent epimerase/dehydratase family protein [Myxococcales bacterium]